jgi:hypothetical protein|tara:strand:+ start:1687 stop:2127 length:441 start_codon:yes stop_codon:yes gene_type:complete
MEKDILAGIHVGLGEEFEENKVFELSDNYKFKIREICKRERTNLERITLSETCAINKTKDAIAIKINKYDEIKGYKRISTSIYSLVDKDDSITSDLIVRKYDYNKDLILEDFYNNDCFSFKINERGIHTFMAYDIRKRKLFNSVGF